MEREEVFGERCDLEMVMVLMMILLSTLEISQISSILSSTSASQKTSPQSSSKTSPSTMKTNDDQVESPTPEKGSWWRRTPSLPSLTKRKLSFLHVRSSSPSLLLPLRLVLFWISLSIDRHHIFSIDTWWQWRHSDDVDTKSCHDCVVCLWAMSTPGEKKSQDDNHCWYWSLSSLISYTQ